MLDYRCSGQYVEVSYTAVAQGLVDASCFGPQGPKHAFFLFWPGFEVRGECGSLQLNGSFGPN